MIILEHFPMNLEFMVLYIFKHHLSFQIELIQAPNLNRWELHSWKHHPCLHQFALQEEQCDRHELNRYEGQFLLRSFLHGFLKLIILWLLGVPKPIFILLYFPEYISVLLKQLLQSLILRILKDLEHEIKEILIARILIIVSCVWKPLRVILALYRLV